MRSPVSHVSLANIFLCIGWMGALRSDRYSNRDLLFAQTRVSPSSPAIPPCSSSPPLISAAAAAAAAAMDAMPSYLGRPTLRSTSSPSSSRSAAADSDSPSSLSSSYSFAAAASASAVSQSLASILNNPHAGRSDASWSLWWPSGGSAAGAGATDTPRRPPPPSPSPSSRETAAAAVAAAAAVSADGEVRGQGEALVACLREVPSLFFKEDFALEEGVTFQAACPFSPSPEENTALQERLTQYLDVVEMHLVREISLRSNSFFEAQGQLQGLNGQIVESCMRIRELKETIRILTGDLVGSARQVQELNATRANLVALQQKLTVILYVNQALSALKLLVAAADCAGALDVTDDLQHLLETDELAGLHCFRHLRDHLSASLDSVNSILSAEFLRAAIHDVRAVDSMILSILKRKPSSLLNGIEDEVKLDDDENSALRDRLLPLIICLLRTAKLPAVLRIYRDTLITDMKASIKATVAELLPVLVARPMEADLAAAERVVDSEAGGPSLASKLRNLSSESFVQLLAAIFKVVQAHLMRAAEVKKVIEWIMGNIDGYYSSDTSAVGSVVSESIQESGNHVVSHNSYPLARNSPRISIFQGRINDTSSPSASRNFRADVLRENTEAVFSACDAAHGRWAKLLGVRALLHPRLRLQEFLSIYNITQDFIAATEKIGGRLGYSIRGTLQSQSKAFVDFQHDARMTKIKAVLDQETWVAVDVPDEFQAIVEALSSTDSPVNSFEPTATDGTANVVESEASAGQEYLSLNESVENSADHPNEIAVAGQESTAESTPPTRIDNNKTNEHVRSTSQTLMHGGVGYHMMLSEYVDISRCLPSLSSEVVHRVVEILKLFNTRTCQLVLGAGAMQVSGLKSITSKHLALASQVISFIYAIIPDIRRVLFLKIPEVRRALLMSEVDRVAQDYKVHRDEIHTKLVQIMRERLLANLRKLPQIVEGWNGPEDNDLQLSQFAKSVTKEVTYLHRILSQTLLELDVQAIFRQVVQIFHSHITEAFSKLDVNTLKRKQTVSRCATYSWMYTKIAI
uniref:Vacuolar protein sorting-associated protein 54 C-terminal domain-containing protein n=1 Tax=Ananas comosus var. bracteatus TaxID=296719 RepID=A0A6V7QKZ3_ANACO|nr:unnamed protein product [Ananas comosus var. bracteatus]